MPDSHNTHQDSQLFSQSRLFSRREAIGLVAALGGAVLLSGPVPAFADTQSDLDAAQAQLDQVQQQIDQIASEYEQLSEQQSQTMDQIEQTQTQIDQTQAEIDQKEKDIADKQDVLSKRIASNYKAGNKSVIDLILSSATIDDFVTNIYYMDKISENDRQMIDDIKQEKDELDQKKSSLEDSKSQLEDLNAQQTQQLADMRAKQDETQQLIDSLSQQVKDLMAQRDAEILAAAQAAEAARKAAAKAAASSSSVSAYSGNVNVTGDSDYASANAAQRSIVNACYTVPSPGGGYCAAWVEEVYAAAGQGSFSGDACDLYSQYCTSSNTSDLKPGMIVAVSTHPHTSAGRIYGHVGIYVGSGVLMDNVGYIRSVNVNDWISYYGATVTPRWGWLGGGNLA